MKYPIIAGTIAVCLAPLFASAADTDSEAARLKKLEAAVSTLQQQNAQLQSQLSSATSTEYAGSTASKIVMSEPVTQVKLYGEVRMRYFINEGVAAGLDAGDTGQRDRLRYRLRLGADVKLTDGWTAGVMLETGNVARSANVTLGDNSGAYFAKAAAPSTSVLAGTTITSGTVVTGINAKTGKPVTGTAVTSVAASSKNVVASYNFGDTLFVGRVFLKYQPTDWLTVTAGKMANPYVSTRMVWDPDLSPEGIAEQFKFTLGGSHGPSGDVSKDGKDVKETPEEGMTVDIFGNFGQFIYSDVGYENNFNTGTAAPFSVTDNSADLWQLGFQLGTQVNFNKSTFFKIAPTIYTYVGTGSTATGNGSAITGAFNGDNALVILDKHAQPALITFNQTGVNDLLVLDIPVEFDWKMFGIPFSVFGDFADNLDASTRAAKAGHPDKREGIAYQAGMSIGQAKKKGDFELRGWYQHSEQYALDQNIIDDDIFDGRLNMQGYFVQATYMVSDAASVILQYGHGSRIDPNLGTAGFGALGTASGFPLQSTNLVYVDLNVKF